MPAKSKLALTNEKIQVKWGIDLFSLFIRYTAHCDTISSSQMHTLQEELSELSQAALGEDTPETIAQQLNQYIGMINAQIKQATELTKYAPFPTFSFATGAFLRSGVLDQIDMVERTLTQAAEGKVLDWEKESAYFSKVLEVFSQVESEQITGSEGMAKLAGELTKINQKLPEEHAFPLPDLNAYE